MLAQGFDAVKAGAGLPRSAVHAVFVCPGILSRAVHRVDELGRIRGTDRITAGDRRRGGPGGDGDRRCLAGERDSAGLLADIEGSAGGHGAVVCNGCSGEVRRRVQLLGF